MASTRDEVYVNIVADTKKAVAGMAKWAAGLTAAVVVLRKVYQSVKAMEQAFFVQETAERKFTAALMATGRQAEISAENIFSYASALQKATTFGDEQIISASALLQQLANLDEEGLKKVIPSMLDFSVAMGVDLQTAASLIGKTIGSTTNALTRYGVEIDMSGDASEKLSALVVGLEEKFQGVAVAIGETAYGASVKLKNAWSDLKEAGGELASKGLQPVREWLTKIIEGMAEGRRKALLLKEAFEDFDTEGKQLEEVQRRIEAINAKLDYYKGLEWLFPKYVRGLKEELALLVQTSTNLQMNERALGELSIAEKTAASEASLFADQVGFVNDAWDEFFPQTTQAKIELLIEQLRAMRDMGNKTPEQKMIFGDLIIALQGITFESEKVVESLDLTNASIETMGEDALLAWVAMEKLKKVNAEMAEQEAAQQEQLQKTKDIYMGYADAILGVADAFGAMVGGAEEGWRGVLNATKSGIVGVLQMYAKLWAVQSVAAFAGGNLVSGFNYGAAAVGASVAGGIVNQINFNGPVAGERAFEDIAYKVMADTSGAP